MSISKKGWTYLAGFVIVVFLIVGFILDKTGILPVPGFTKSKVIESSTELAELNDPVAASIAADVAKLPLPSNRAANVPGPEIRFGRWFWNAHLPCDYAVGGETPREGSLVAQHGVNLRMVWEDMTPKLAEGMLQFATLLSKGNPHPREGFHFVSVMGDQTAGFIGPLNNQLRKLGDEYQAEVVYSCGRSNGEDQLMGPASWKSNPQNALGKTVITVLPEGDWNIVVKWARDNNLKFNPDVKTYDAEAVNIWHAPDNNEAASTFVAKTCESRPVVKDGKPTGEKHQVCPEAASVWTPSDEVVALQRGGVVRIVSTREYSGQMPNVVIGIRKWNRDNKELVTKMVQAFGEGGDQVLAHEEALQRAAEASADVYKGSKSPAWILKYYKGTTVRDPASGDLVELGGSRAHNLADNLRWFVQSDMFCATHTVFGNIVHELYPDNLPEVPRCKDILNTEYIEEAARRSKVTRAETPTFAGGAVRDVVSTQKVHINFRVGSAELTPKAESQLEELYQGLLVASDLAIELSGHTDNTGTPQGNLALSEERAFAVKRWLQNRSRSDFPDSRFAKVTGYGQERALEPNSTETGRQANRRVEVVLGRQQ